MVLKCIENLKGGFGTVAHEQLHLLSVCLNSCLLWPKHIAPFGAPGTHYG